MIYFTKHTDEKFSELKRHGFTILKEQVLEVVKRPERIDYRRLPQIIAQRKIDSRHVLRVVYKIANDDIKVITFYVGRIRQYEK